MPRILIIDDSESLRTLLRKDLEAAGHEVLEADDGINGLEALTNHVGRLDVVLCDVNMPRMDGLTMIEKAREIDGCKTLPVVMLTTEANAAVILRAKQAGVMAWMLKPYTVDKLSAAIKRVLAK